MHVNHHLRGEASNEDAEFVKALAAKLGCLAFFATWTSRARRGIWRRMRGGRGWRSSASNWPPVRLPRIALGHTRSDQAETVLFRFLRGTGATGLAAIRPVTREGIVRPLIDMERAEIERLPRERA